LTNAQIRTLAAGYRTFIQNHSGANLSEDGAKVVAQGDVPSEAVNFVRAASQFVGAAGGGWRSDLTINVGNSEALSYAKYGWDAVRQGYRVYADTFAVTPDRNNIWINSDSARQFRNASELARTMFHERYHTAGGRWGDGITDRDHKMLDGWARSRLMQSGLGDSGCAAIGGIFGLFATYPACR
jgi:hypothetical protein